jgi:hypothetical protein
MLITARKVWRSAPKCRARRACALARAWHDSYVPVVLLVAGLVILVAVVLVAAGRGGELPVERADYAPLDLGPASATDVALLRPPTNAWGYNMQATDEAMAQIAESIRERDIRIVALEQLVTDLSKEPAPPSLTSPSVGARRRALPAGAQPVTGAGQQPGTPQPGEDQPPETAHPAETTWSAGTAWSRESARPAEQAWPATPTRPDIPALTGEGAEPEAGTAGEASPGEGQVGPPERSHG